MRFILPILLFSLPAAALAHEQCTVRAIENGEQLVCLGEDGTSRTVRLRGIEAPGEPFDQRASEALRQLALGKLASLHAPQKEADGTTRAAIWVEPADCPGCGQTLDVGRALLSVGLARWRQADRQGAEERGQYKFEEQQAQARHIGLWRTP
ncbi:thermonuclease family protein [Pseudomonas sp. ZM23]|uniref:Thermonuclease family protein n=1 Tax=Pseudomonas triclosanedens TaxID=2961893 RepID=A0ABY7A3W1_9PSED|nr:thermonuclease family protein [Pseudomonas triclosanedens]MCP8465806.1 thermonuclease family protein [Pseudomonas triclosanedens]MCP8471301.1 thermonuclease family protein [Pseudomonas triclosanedens]MCP8477105.1 thermonuclease family protein [Pseudomonas triclosanedens]WAI51788.1 thermonuclease family protein [Pseudomonas triclosanedens]